jgi:hypothetical protein
MRISLPVAALVAAWLLLALGIEPVPTWFYVFAWYPSLAALDGVAVRLGRPSLFARSRAVLSLFAWSPVIWLVFEAANFRLANWYYVNLPRAPAERWAGILLSFATVLPAIVLAERALAAAGVFTRGRRRPVIIRPWELRASVGIALVAAVLVMLWPRYFFPLIWGVGLLLAEPLVYRRAPDLSLFRDLERGDWGRAGRLLVGGLGIGFLWELYNHVAVGRWIYTVPWLETLKLFEMPPLGFLGFPVFALEAWAMYAALCAVGVALPPVGDARLTRPRTVRAAIVAAGFTIAVLAGMERWTISSTVPRVDDLPDLSAAVVRALDRAGVQTVEDLATAEIADVARYAALDTERARAAIETARLVDLRGIGARHALALREAGIMTVCQLADRDATTLLAALQQDRPAPRLTAAEVRVWVRAARRTCGEER